MKNKFKNIKNNLLLLFFIFYFLLCFLLPFLYVGPPIIKQSLGKKVRQMGGHDPLILEDPS